MSESTPAFGIQIACAGMSWPECLEICTTAEKLGYESVWVPDHYVSTPDALAPDIKGDVIDGWMALGAMAQATSRIRLGPLVSSNTFRHPAILAKMAATLDHISNGRLEFGIGAGWFEFEHTSLGLPFPGAGRRLKALEEAIQIIKALWTQDEVNFEGAYYTLKGAVSMPKPVQQPTPPIVIGASGEKVALRNVARYADHWNVFCPPKRYAHKTQVLAEHCKAEGRAPSDIKRSVMIPAYLWESPQVSEKIHRWGQMTRTTEEEAREWFLLGSKADMQRTIDAYVKEGAQLIIVQVDYPGRNVETVREFARMFL